MIYPLLLAVFWDMNTLLHACLTWTHWYRYTGELRTFPHTLYQVVYMYELYICPVTYVLPVDTTGILLQQCVAPRSFHAGYPNTQTGHYPFGHE